MPKHTFEKSSAIAHCEHDEDNNCLTITFQSGKKYRYGEFYSNHFEEFKKVKSAGSYFAQSIKNKHPLLTDD